MLIPIQLTARVAKTMLINRCPRVLLRVGEIDSFRNFQQPIIIMDSIESLKILSKVERTVS